MQNVHAGDEELTTNTGTVIAINARRGYIVVQIDQGDFVLFELLDSLDIAKGDRLAGHLEGLGSETLTHLGHTRKFEAYGQTGPSTLTACKNIFSS